MFAFVIDRDVPAANNVSERALRPSVIFHKVTNARKWLRYFAGFQLGMGRGHLRCLPLRRQHRQCQPPIRLQRPLSRDGSNLIPRDRNLTRVSNYE
jgi:hypothetical protein